MPVKQNEKAFFEKGFEDDIALQELQDILKLFPNSEDVSLFFHKRRKQNRLTDMKRGELYPEIIGSAALLRRVIASIYEITPQQAQPNFGCNGCIDTFLSYIQYVEFVSGRRKGFLVATPTYFRYYQKIESLRMNLLEASLTRDFEYPVDEIISRAKKDSPSCLFLVTPNNPTGVPIPDKQLYEILDNVPDDLNIAVDRTCVNIETEAATKTLLKKYGHKKLVIFHSFSKYYAMSHLRIGFSVFSNDKFASEVERYLPFGLNLEAMLKAIHILKTQAELTPNIQITSFIRENKRLMNQFLESDRGYWCSDFKSNYALLRLPKNITSYEFHERMQNLGITVMPGHELPAPDDSSVRIHTGGNPEYLSKMLEAITSWN